MQMLFSSSFSWVVLTVDHFFAGCLEKVLLDVSRDGSECAPTHRTPQDTGYPHFMSVAFQDPQPLFFDVVLCVTVCCVCVVCAYMYVRVCV